ncbi:methenyltetrahydrofolate synthase domain-containing protein isoform X3 [Prionailurus bengalensis]|uniref:methenyltetrahydrofolate synthase domain-containing protein isoform X3 n=1 Tax=Prionailurus bengalensis TaxID=37029 RepID=UPI001CA7C587|nr:methenyltetrahydrofolate synthase domain-containing protein isoform X3 [Prionailurus bengalensis]
MELRTGVSKQDIREQIWDYMESRNLADFPRPVHHRIPNFKGSYLACQNIRDLEVFARTREVKVDPDKPLEGIRLLALQSKKTLLVPTPRLRTGLFNKIMPPPGATKDVLRKCATSQGVRNYSTPVGLDSRVLVDLVVVGSVAVSEKGWRIGKGEGYADLEYAMMVSMGAVGPETPVVTIVHDCQVIDIPEALLEDHDLTVDYILTPTRVIATGCERPKPTGILWSKISWEVMGKIPVLQSLRHREKQAGKDVTLRDEPRRLLGASSQQPAHLTAVRGPRDQPLPEPCPAQGEDGPTGTVCVGNLPRDARVSELKRALRELGAVPQRLTWQGPRGRALLHYQAPASAQQAVSRLQGLRLGAATLTVALARRQRASDLPGGRVQEPQPDCRPAAADL